MEVVINTTITTYRMVFIVSAFFALSSGWVVGSLLTMSSYCFFAALLTFFITGSRVTKFRKEKKKLQEADYKEGKGDSWSCCR